MGLTVFNLGLVGEVSLSGKGIVNSLLRQPRVRLTEVFDTCLASAESQAQEFEATCSPNLAGLIKKTQGIVVASIGWTELEPIIRAAEIERPVLILSQALAGLQCHQLAELQQLSLEKRVLIMPEMLHRWARSTLRLRELTATQVGAIERVVVECATNLDSHQLENAIDWCVNVMQSECQAVSTASDGKSTTLIFRRVDGEGKFVTAVLNFHDQQASAFPIISAKVQCRHGSLELSGEKNLSWQHASKSLTEVLSTDRSAGDVMFDLFGRRLAGGLVPVPEIADVIKARAIRSSCFASLNEQAEVRVRPISG
ncbi:hypothetical protein SH668x_003050 [Planctomicrobium sp. SH668]|uniref:hypothetical protein n=1 Tax=Planctomicrobium sp. SH668 TaxID=3448126 RepID=UPI003F5C1885